MMSTDAMGGIPKFVHVTDADKDTRNSVLELADGSRGVLQLNHFYIDPSVLVLNHYFTKVSQNYLIITLPPTRNSVLCAFG
jgi:hypothetical protein